MDLSPLPPQSSPHHHHHHLPPPLQVHPLAPLISWQGGRRLLPPFRAGEMISRLMRGLPGKVYRSDEIEDIWANTSIVSGKSNGNYHTKCHNGTLLPFRARCNQVRLALVQFRIFLISKFVRTLNAPWQRMSLVATGTWSQRFQRLIVARSSKSKMIPWLCYWIVLMSDLSRIMRTTDTVIVEFFAPWCPACVTFKPEFEKLQDRHWDIPMYTVYTENVLKGLNFILILRLRWTLTKTQSWRKCSMWTHIQESFCSQKTQSMIPRSTRRNGDSSLTLSTDGSKTNCYPRKTTRRESLSIYLNYINHLFNF